MVDGSTDSGHIERLQRALSEARGYASSDDGSVKVEVGANGSLYGIHLSEGGGVRTARELAAMIADLHRVAAGDAAVAISDALTALGNSAPVQPEPPRPGPRSSQSPSDEGAPRMRARGTRRHSPKTRPTAEWVDGRAPVRDGRRAEVAPAPEVVVPARDPFTPWGEPASDPRGGIEALLPEDDSLDFLNMHCDWSELS